MKLILGMMVLILSINTASAGPVYQMNKAFIALTGLIPYLSDEKKFQDKNNEKVVVQKLSDLQLAFKQAKHDTLLKEDLFAPSYKMVISNLDDGLTAFKKGQKDYAYWRMKEFTANCIECHSRLPQNYVSSFQNGELQVDQKMFTEPYNQGVANLIVRRYPDAKALFIRAIQDHYIAKNFENIELPFKQLLLIDAKILRMPDQFKATVSTYLNRKETPESLKNTLTEWLKRLEYWSKKPYLKTGLDSEDKLATFLSTEMLNIKNGRPTEDGAEVDMLMAAGLLSQYSFQNPQSSKSAEINYWMGWVEKRLQRDHFFGSGDLFLKQCMRKYPAHPIAHQCYEEYKESVEFEFTGSGGTDIPDEVMKELQEYKRLLK